MDKYEALRDYQNIANEHASRLAYAIEKTSAWFPLTEAAFSKIPEEAIAFFDMLSSRFARLQDLIGAKIFSLALHLLGEEDLSSIDKLQKLEKLGYIDSARWWMQLRDIRNQLTHDYPGSEALLVLHFNQALPEIKKLLVRWQSIETNLVIPLLARGPL